jgi:hypothetical protein
MLNPFRNAGYVSDFGFTVNLLHAGVSGAFDGDQN